MMYLFPVPAPSRPSTAAAPLEVGGPRFWFDQAGILICRPLKDTSCKLATPVIDFKIVSTEINEHMHTRKLPVRLAIHLEPALEHATVVAKITPAE